MDWTNERYVRIYTRDTTKMLLMRWDERCLFWDLLRKVDRAGILDLEGHGPPAVGVHLRCPPEVAERAVTVWLNAGWVEIRGDFLVIPSHIDAQESAQSDRQRQRDSRERRRDLARAEVTICDPGPCRRDTPAEIRDKSSQLVTVGHSVPSQPSQPSQKKNVEPEVPDPDLETIQEVWAHYLLRRAEAGKRPPEPKLDKTRIRRIRARLRDGFTVARLKRAVDGIWGEDFNVEQGYTSDELCFRNQAKVEMYEGKAAKHDGAKSAGDHHNTTSGHKRPDPADLAEARFRRQRAQEAAEAVPLSAAAPEVRNRFTALLGSIGAGSAARSTDEEREQGIQRERQRQLAALGGDE